MPSSPAKHLLQRRNMGKINAYVKTKTKIALTARNINNDFPTICERYFFVAKLVGLTDMTRTLLEAIYR